MTGEDLIRRSDDNEDTLRKRLETYHTQTHPLVDYYKKLDLHCCIDATQTPEEVYTQLVSIAVKK